ncbi:GNAT family N-acetyltransferase [Novosphingobium aquiterrae]|uniref:GNAT family N-acetyltransferase n=1 Tax=Novosphingobium aquiterrae TaxID=624388 RepID=A0ABV6PHP3_9SPHN
MVVVNYHDDLNEVQGDPVLAALLSAPAAAAPFDRIDWWRNLVKNCDILPLIAVATDGTQRLVLPLMRRARTIIALGNWYNFRLTPLATADANRPALLRALAEDLAGQAPRIILEKLSESDAAELAAAFRSTGWSVWQSVSDINHMLKVGGRSYAEYLAARPGPLRTTLKRKGSKVEVSLYRSFDLQAYEAYEDIYAASWKPEEGSPTFLRRFAEEEGATGRLRMAVARVAGKPVAAQLWTVESGTAFIHKLAHREDAKALSPGTTLSAALFAEVIDRDRVALIDFGTGDDAYKRDWMEQVRPRYRLDMLRPRWPGNWPIIVRNALRAATGRG